MLPFPSPYQQGAVYRKRRIYPEYTAAWVIQLAREAQYHPIILEMLRPFVRNLYSVNEHPQAARYSELCAILYFVMGRVRYTYDPTEVELIYHPVEILHRIVTYGRWIEDCESIAGLVLAFMLMLGFPCRLTIVAFFVHEPFEHIFAEAHIKDLGWIVVDPSMGWMGRVSAMSRDIVRSLSFYP